METDTLLKTGLDQLHIAYENRQIEQLAVYASEIESWNMKFNLVKASGDDLIIRHLFDSLAALPVFRQQKRKIILDIGTGAGLPGIPLAVFLPDSRIILNESTGKKVTFLKNAIDVIGLKNTDIFHGDFNVLKEKADIVTFRAFSAIPPALRNLVRRLKPGGSIIAYKGRREKIDEELSGLNRRGLKVDIIKIEVPFLNEERHLVTIKLL